MSHTQPCNLGFRGSACPECHLLAANRRDQLAVTLRLAELSEGELREVLADVVRRDLDIIKDAMTETGVGA